MRRMILPALLVAFAGGIVCAQPEPSLALTAREAAEALDGLAPSNAALVYNQVFPQLTTELELAHQSFELEPPDPETLQMSRETAAETLAGAEELIERLVWASRLPECDFGLQYGDGWRLLLPHLGKLRTATRVLRADALRLAGDGELDKAADRVDAMFGIADQVRHDRVLISSLVSIAIAAHAVDTASYLAEHGQLTADGRDMLIARMEALRADDYFRLLDCVTMEYTVSVGWLAKMPEGSKASGWLEGMGVDDASRRAIERLDAMGRDALLADAERMRGYYESVLKVWDDPHPVDKIDALGELAGQGAYGECGRLFLASMGRVKASELKILGTLDAKLPELYACRPAGGTEKPEAATPTAGRE